MMRRQPLDAEVRMAALGMSTALLYATSYAVQRSIFLGGPPAAPLRWAASGVAGRAGMLGQASLYAVVTVGLFVAYRAVLSMSARGEITQPRVLGWALLMPCAISLLMMFGRPWLSQDMFSYMAHGFLGVVRGGNPLLQPAEAAASTAIGPGLRGYGWHGEIGITPYGIAWTRIEMSVMEWSGGNLARALILLKGVVVAASLGTGYFIWVYLGATQPALQAYGTLAYLWNPLTLSEFAGEGHNDAVMALFVVAALAACAARWTVSSVLAQMLGVLVKHVSLLFCPAQLVYLWRTRRSATLFGVELAAALCIVAAIAVFCYAPVWAGSHSIDGLLRRAEPMSSATPFGVINWCLRRSPLAAEAATLTVAAVTAPLLALVAWASLRVTDVASLARACAWISLGYVLLAAPDYWPWYACLPVVLIILAETDRLMWLAMLMSLTARLCAPLDLLRGHGFIGMVVAKGATTGLGASLPLAILVIWLYRRRKSGTHDGITHGVP